MNRFRFELEKSLITESIEDKGILHGVIFGGTPGAGKSFTLKQIKSGSIEPRIVNTDKFTEFMAETLNVSPNEIGKDWEVYKTNVKKLSTTQLALYLNSLLPLFIDGTSSNPPAVFRRTGILKSIGYDVGFIWVSTDLETALKRNRERKRNVSEDFIIETHKKIQKLKPYYQAEFNNFYEIKNGEGELNDESILKAFRKVNGFFNSAVKNPIGSELIKEMRNEGYKYLVDLPRFDMQNIKKWVSGWYAK